MTSTVDTTPTVAQRVLVIVGLLIYLATGFIYLTSGLVVPGLALFLLWFVWLVGIGVVARMVARWSLWVLAAGPVAMVFWWLYLMVGEALFGWAP